MKRVFLLLLPLLACQQQKFVTSTQPVPLTRQADSIPIQVVAKSLSSAKPNVQGSGQLVVKTAAKAEVMCLDCPANVALSFDGGTLNSDGLADYSALFSYPFVSATEVCNIQLRVRYETGRIEVIKYALYNCPVDMSQRVSKCDTNSPRRVCPI